MATSDAAEEVDRSISRRKGAGEGVTSGNKIREIEVYPTGERETVLRPGLSGSSIMVLGAGESTPGMNGAGISESICEMSTVSSAELLAAANWSQDKSEPRSFPDFFGLGLSDGGLSFGRGDR